MAAAEGVEGGEREDEGEVEVGLRVPRAPPFLGQRWRKGRPLGACLAGVPGAAAGEGPRGRVRRAGVTWLLGRPWVGHRAAACPLRAVGRCLLSGRVLKVMSLQLFSVKFSGKQC